MNLNNLTFVYFIEEYSQEKLLYLKYKDNINLNLLLIYSNLKANLFSDNILLTDKNFFSDCLAEIFSRVNTDYFIYLKPEEDIPFIDDKQGFDQPYYFFEINYNFPDDKLVVSELRLYNRLKILNEGIENIDIDDCYKPVVINNYHYFYHQIEESITKKHLSLIKKNIYREDSINYLALNNIKLFHQKSLETNFLLNENVFLNIKENSENKLSSNYLYSCINLLVIYLKEKNYEKFTEHFTELESLVSSPTVTFIKAIYYKIIGHPQTSIEYFDKTMQLANSNYYKHIAFSKSWIDYYSIYQKAEVYKHSGQIEQAINQYEECLELSPSKKIIKEAKAFIENNQLKIKQTDFKCESCGNCCRSKLINITHNDVKNILENRPDLMVEDFIDFVQVNQEMKEFNHQDLFIANNQKNMMVLKKKAMKKECIFLGEENKCAVHLFKPLACKAWPFVIRESDKELMWSLHERDFIKKHCAHSFEENNQISEIENNIIEFKKDRSAFIEAVYYWNTDNLNKSNKYDFVNYSLKLSNQEIVKLNKQISQDIVDKFSHNENISVIEFKPFTSQYFVETNNTFSYAVYLEENKFLNEEVLEQIKNLLQAESYLILNQPETHISFFINNHNKYTVNIFIYLKSQKINISENSEILYKDNLVTINTVSSQEMLNIKVNQLKNRFEYLIEVFRNIYNEQDIRKSIDTINVMIFSLIAWINKKSFEIPKYNQFEYIIEDFNQYLLSNNQNAKDQKELKKLLENSYNVFSKYLKIFENITLI